MAKKWIIDDEVEVCDHCQFEIFPGSKIYVSNGKHLFDKPKCAASYNAEWKIENPEIVEYILATG